MVITEFLETHMMIDKLKIGSKQLGLVFLAFLMGSDGSYASIPPNVANSDVVEAFVDGVVKASMKNAKSSAGVVAVMKDGEMIFSKGYGFLDVEKRIPVDPNTTLFRPGSISKLFTWVAVMQQVEQGNVDLDVDVNGYLKSLKVANTWPGQPVTLRHIMTHTAGFEDGFLGYLIIDDPSRIMPLEQSLAKYQPQRINPPGVHTAYSNWATALAGLVVEEVSGMSFNDYVQRHIFDTLGMTHSSFLEPLPPRLASNVAKAYGYSQGRYVELNYEIISNFGPAGAAAVSARDMSIFAQALLNGGAVDGKRILKSSTLQQMVDGGFTHDPRVRGMGLGFLKRRYGRDDLEVFGHDGGTTIFSSHLGLSSKENFMLFSSFGGPGAKEVHSTFVKSFYDEFFPSEASKVDPPADFFERGKRYEGTYHSWRSSFTKIESLLRLITSLKVVLLPDNTLMIGGKRYVEIDTNLFQEADDNGRIAFQEDVNGKITGLVIDGFGVMQFYRAPFYETGQFIMLSLGSVLLIFMHVLLQAVYRRREFNTLVAFERKAVVASILLAATHFSFLTFAAVGASGGLIALMYDVPLTLKIALIFPILAALLTLYHIYCTFQVLRHGGLEGPRALARLIVVNLAGLYMVWFYSYWNLLGFNYFS